MRCVERRFVELALVCTRQPNCMRVRRRSFGPVYSYTHSPQDDAIPSKKQNHQLMGSSRPSCPFDQDLNLNFQPGTRRNSWGIFVSLPSFYHREIDIPNSLLFPIYTQTFRCRKIAVLDVGASSFPSL
uniref:Uncharacterized protein n=1 Tax=Lotharella globosa TaxID=91324 RepID=A0A7S3YAS4_9EUKA